MTGFSFEFNYTWSHAIDNVSSPTDNSGQFGGASALELGRSGLMFAPTNIDGWLLGDGGLTRTTESVDINGGPPTLLYTDTAAKFFSSVNTTGSALSPDRRWLLYTSDVTGWDQIYVVPTAGLSLSDVALGLQNALTPPPDVSP